MANEIVILGISREETRNVVDAMFLHVLLPPIEVGGVQVAPTPSSTLPTLVTSLNLLAGAELAGLDSGAGVFELATINMPPNVGLAAAAARLKSAFANSTFVSEMRDRYAFVGRRVSA